MEAVAFPSQDIMDRILHNPNVGFYAKQFQEKKLLIINHFLPEDYVKSFFVPEVNQCLPYVHRVKVGSFKKSGSISSQLLSQHAPELYALYHSPIMKQFVENVVGEPVQLCPDDDPHAVALYYYTEPGDHIGVHYDKSFYRGRRYTVLIGLIQDSHHSKLVCYPGSHKFNRRKNPIDVYTHPGTFVVFDGDVLWHEVTPLAENERRVILTMEYVTDNRMGKISRAVSHFKDRLLYFGKK